MLNLNTHECQRILLVSLKLNARCHLDQQSVYAVVDVYGVAEAISISSPLGMFSLCLSVKSLA